MENLAMSPSPSPSLSLSPGPGGGRAGRCRGRGGRGPGGAGRAAGRSNLPRRPLITMRGPTLGSQEGELELLRPGSLLHSTVPCCAGPPILKGVVNNLSVKSAPAYPSPAQSAAALGNLLLLLHKDLQERGAARVGQPGLPAAAPDFLLQRNRLALSRDGLTVQCAVHVVVQYFQRVQSPPPHHSWNNGLVASVPPHLPLLADLPQLQLQQLLLLQHRPPAHPALPLLCRQLPAGLGDQPGQQRQLPRQGHLIPVRPGPPRPLTAGLPPRPPSLSFQ